MAYYTANESEQELLVALNQLAAQYRSAEATANEEALALIHNNYLLTLSRLQAMGWVWALGEQAELPDAAMPHDYIVRRTEILDKLEGELGECAIKYWGANSPVQTAEAITAYHEVMNEMFRIGHWHYPAPDSLLPDEDMPPLYIEMLNEGIKNYREEHPDPWSDYLVNAVREHDLLWVTIIASPAKQILKARVEKIYSFGKAIQKDAITTDIEFISTGNGWGNVELKTGESALVFLSLIDGRLYQHDQHFIIEKIDGVSYATHQPRQMWNWEGLVQKIKENTMPDPRNENFSLIRFATLEAYLQDLILCPR